jgi:hypothetical protein
MTIDEVIEHIRSERATGDTSDPETQIVRIHQPGCEGERRCSCVPVAVSAWDERRLRAEMERARREN